jgi:NAD(P)-dependent dehydrogenase (short-subunit alcohol dehydrogenase family)
MLSAMDLTGTAAIISGGASGLGEATARALAAAGSTVVIADLNLDRGEAVAAEIGGKFVQTDVADEASVTIAVDVAAALPSPLRVVVSCAGIGWAERTVNRDGSPHSFATFRKVIDINLIGTFNLMRLGAAVARTGLSIPTASAAWSSTPRPWFTSGRLGSLPLGIQGRD